jgi:hypothetical protein
MALTVSLVPDGLHHAVTSGSITVNPVPGYGEVAALGANQLLKLLLPFADKVIDKVGYQEQFYILAKLLDASVSNVMLDAIQFELDPVTGQSVVRLRVDIAVAPGNVLIWLESHHSAGR